MSDPFHDVQLGMVESFDDVCEFWRWASKARDCFAMDLETSGLSPWDPGARIRLIQIGDEHTGWAIPYERYSGIVKEVIEKTRTPIVWHNSGFDLKWLAVKDPDFPLRYDLAHDTMIIARLVDPAGSAALKKLAVQLWGPGANAAQQALEQGMLNNDWGWDTVPISWPTYSTYGASDVVLTARLFKHFQPWLQDPRNARVYDLEMATRRICTQMEIKGFRVNMDYVREAYERMNEYTHTVAHTIRDTYGFEIGSNPQITRWLLGKGVHIERRTPGGNPSADKDELDRLLAEGVLDKEATKLVETALLYRKATKIAGSYFANFLKWGEADGGLVHPSINTLAARTSRMSVTDPALQTLHRDNLSVRDSFIPYDVGESLVTCDSDQIEARLFANFSQDTALIDAFDGRVDFFVNIARRVHSDPSIVKKDKRRQTIKNYVYSKLYGAGVRKMAITAGVPYATMKALDDAMKLEFPGIRTFQDKVTDQAVREGYVETPFGRRLPIGDPDKAYIAVNYLIQGHAAECLKQAIVNADHSDLGEFMHVPVHDELVLSVPDDQVREVKATLAECMTHDDPTMYRVPLTAGADGPFQKWGDGKR